jgi:hypothetical protein
VLEFGSCIASGASGVSPPISGVSDALAPV